MEPLTELLLRFSSALLIPDIVILLLLSAATILHLGGLIGEAVVRSQRAPKFRQFVAGLKSGPPDGSGAFDSQSAYGLPKKALSQVTGGNGDRDKVLDDLQLEAERLLGRLLLGVRLGPILGLAGTLIPLGPALVALSQGDYEMLSQRLVVAFATTVLGLFVGGLCFAMHAVRKHWYMQDLSDVEFVLSRGGAS